MVCFCSSDDFGCFAERGDVWESYPTAPPCWSLCRGSLATSSCSKDYLHACQRTQTTSKTLRVSARAAPYLLHWPPAAHFLFPGNLALKRLCKVNSQDKRQNVRMTLCEYQVLYPLQNRWSWSPQRPEHSNAAIRKMVSAVSDEHTNSIWAENQHLPLNIPF